MSEVPRGVRQGQGCDAAVLGAVPLREGPPFTRGAPGVGRPDPGPCWPSSPPLPPLRASVPRSHSEARAPCPTEAGRGGKAPSPPGRGDVSAGRASGSLACGRGNRPSRSLAVPERAGPDLPTAIGEGRALCHVVPRWAGTGGGLRLAPGPPRAGLHGRWSKSRSPEGHHGAGQGGVNGGPRTTEGLGGDGPGRELRKRWPQTDTPAGSESSRAPPRSHSTAEGQGGPGAFSALDVTSAVSAPEATKPSARGPQGLEGLASTPLHTGLSSPKPRVAERPAPGRATG